MRRRRFIALLSSAVIAPPLLARAQQSAVPLIGYLRAGGQPEADELAGFRQGLIELGYVENRNVAIEFRNAAQYDHLPAMAAELFRRHAAVILVNGLPAALTPSTNSSYVRAATRLPLSTVAIGNSRWRAVRLPS